MLSDESGPVTQQTRVCFKCIQQDVKHQITTKQLNDKYDKLNQKFDKQHDQLLKLKIEVRMLRNWAKLMKLTPPSPPATPPPPQNEPTSETFDSNYEYCVQKETIKEEQENEDDENKGDEANAIDGIPFVDGSLLEIGTPLKREK